MVVLQTFGIGLLKCTQLVPDCVLSAAGRLHHAVASLNILHQAHLLINQYIICELMYLKRVWHETSGFCHESVFTGPLSILLGGFEFFRYFAEIIANECLSAVSTTPSMMHEKHLKLKILYQTPFRKNTNKIVTFLELNCYHHVKL